MSGPGETSLTVVLLGVSGLLLLVCAVFWLKLAQENGLSRPTIPIHAFRTAAGLTALTFVVLGLATCWLAFASIHWS
jgi:hypothetical protein